MNPEEREEYWRLVNEEMATVYNKRKADPQEGDVVNDITGMQVYLKGKWNLIDYNKPAEVQSLREQWADLAEQRRLAKQMEKHMAGITKVHRGKDLGASTGVHMHIPERQDEKEYTEVELDNATLESYTQGKRDFANELLQLLAAEENELRTYGRTELYGIHKAVSVIQQAINDIQ